MLPYKSLLKIERKNRTPIFLQITKQVIQLIQQGHLGAGSALPSSRALALLLELNRNTVTKAYEELEALGWLEIKARKGVFVVESFPAVLPVEWTKEKKTKQETAIPAFQFYDFPALRKPTALGGQLGFDDGFPDVRLAPVNELARGYAKNMRQLAFENDLYYQDGLGHASLREQLVIYLNETRGLNIQQEQILITRGTIMAIHLAIASTVRKGDKVIVGASSYQTANMVIQHFGGELLSIPVDEDGLVIDAIPDLCKRHAIRAIYVTSHHHHPTTVTLSPERRMRLMQLAQSHQFVILEDDYDYDFHFNNAPVLPLASGDKNGSVLYFGSYTKVIAPAFRVGYLVGPAKLIQSLPKLRRIFDRQGDRILEKTIADLLADGTIRRYLKKSWRQYKERRDICCSLLEAELGQYLHFKKPAGGLALWATFEESIDLPKLSEAMQAKGVYLSNGLTYQSPNFKSIRMGFASMTVAELEHCVRVLKETIQKM